MSEERDCAEVRAENAQLVETIRELEARRGIDAGVPVDPEVERAHEREIDAVLRAEQAERQVRELEEGVESLRTEILIRQTRVPNWVLARLRVLGENAHAALSGVSGPTTEGRVLFWMPDAQNHLFLREVLADAWDDGYSLAIQGVECRNPYRDGTGGHPMSPPQPGADPDGFGGDAPLPDRATNYPKADISGRVWDEAHNRWVEGP